MDTLLRILNSRSASLEKFAYYVWEASLEDTSGLVNFVNKLTEDMDVWSSWRYGGLNGRLRDWAMEAIVTYDDTGNLFGEFVKDHWSGEASTIAGKVYGTKGKAELMYGLLGSTFIKDYTTHAGDYASSWGAILGSVHLSTAFDIPGIVSILPGGILHPTDVPESIITSINGDFRMNLSEHHLYGSSRLVIKSYHSAQYQVVYSDTGTEIYNWQGLGGRKPWHSLVYSDNISSLGTEPYGMAETNEYSVSHQLGMKQYELTNHLGNVQATVSDHRYTLYREEGNSWVVDRYHPVLSSAYDYYPFGMLMPDRYVSDTTSYCQTISQTKWMKKLTEICWTVSAPSSWPTIVTEGSASTTVSVSSVEIDIPAPSSTAEFSVSVTPAEENELVLTASMVSGVGIVEVYEIVGGNEYVLASTPVTASQQHTVTKITFTPTTSEVKVKYKYGTSGWTWHGHSICITKPVMVSETYYVDVCDGGDDKYRFGFNGMEKDNEMKGIGNSLDFGARMYDSRVGRWMSVDPKASKMPSWSPYSFCFDNPIYLIDPNGQEPRWGQLGNLNQILGEMCKALNANDVVTASIGNQLQTLSNYFAADRKFTRDREGNLVDIDASKNIDRYMYTEKAGWIDMHHFFRLVDFTRKNGQKAAEIYAYNSERYQSWDGNPSGWSYEDIASDIAGIEFWLQYGDKLNDGTMHLTSAVEEFFTKLGAVDPSEAPNFEYIPHVINPDYVLKSSNKRGLKGDDLKERHKKVFESRSIEDQERIKNAHEQITD